MKLMIVDDEPQNLELFGCVFETEDDIETVLCESGDKALEKLKTFKPDVILLDIMMPGTDGIEVCRIIKSNPELSNIKIIMITGMAGDEVEQKAKAAGCDRFYLKPIRIPVLMSEVLGD